MTFIDKRTRAATSLPVTRRAQAARPDGVRGAIFHLTRGEIA